jgi:acetyltransferase-like isoleucine patch superfamily enzyme
MPILPFILKMVFYPIIDFIKSVVKLTITKYHNPTLKIGKGVRFSRNTKFAIYNYLADNTTLVDSYLGNYSYLGENTFVQNTLIGNYSCIGPNVKIGLGEHPINHFISTHPVFYSLLAQVGVTFADKQYYDEYSPVKIGNDVWVGANAIIISGITIGNGCIIGAGAVVTKDLPPYSIVGGVPAKIIKYRFNEYEIVQLELLKWWDKDIEWIKANANKMLNINNLDELNLKRY